MDIITYNASWMTFNIYLAFTPVLLCWLILKARKDVVRIMLGILWLLYLPNALYLFTDITHLFNQWGRVDMLERAVLLFQYGALVFLGALTAILALYPIERSLPRIARLKTKKLTLPIIVSINFLVGVGMVFGRVERLNSWEVFTATEKVVNSAIRVFSSPKLLLLALLFGLFTNFMYFLFRKPLIAYLSKIVKNFD